MSTDARNKVAELIEQKYSRLIQHIAQEILKDAWLTEDVYQEVLMKFILFHEDKFEMPPREMKNYLCAAARNTALTMAKKNGRITSAEQEEIDGRVLNMDLLDMEAFHDRYGFGPEVQELLAALDNKDKDILCLKYGEGYEDREIAEITGLSESAVRKRIYRAKLQMQTILLNHERGENDGE